MGQAQMSKGDIISCHTVKTLNHLQQWLGSSHLKQDHPHGLFMVP